MRLISSLRSAQYVVAAVRAIDLDQTVKNGSCYAKRKCKRALECRRVRHRGPLCNYYLCPGSSLALSFLSIMLNEQTKPNWAFYVPICLIERKSNTALRWPPLLECVLGPSELLSVAVCSSC